MLGRYLFLAPASIEPQRAVALAERALTIARREGDPRMAASALLNAGGAHLMRIDVEFAEPLCEEALRAAREVGDRQIETDALNLLGMCADYRGDLSASRTHYEDSLLLARALGHDRKTARALRNLSAIAGTSANSMGRCSMKAKRSQFSSGTARQGRSYSTSPIFT